MVMSRWTSLLLLLGALGACAPERQAVAPPAAPAAPAVTFTVDGVKYASRAAALAATRQKLGATLDAIPGERDPLSGRARIVVPDRDRLRPLVTQQVKRAGEILEFALDADHDSLRAMADAVVRVRAFETATAVEQNDTADPDIGDADYLVWYQVRSVSANNTGPWTGGWFVRRAGSDGRNPAGMDPGVAPGTPRYASFIKSVREAAIRLGGLSVAAAGPGTAAADKGRRTVGSGSGIVLDAAGHVLTNNHVVGACSDVRIVDAAHDAETAALVARDPSNDLALLKAPLRGPKPARFRDGPDLQPGESVVVAGYPLANMLGSDMAVTTGSLTRLTGPRDDTRLLQLSAPVQPGNSGGPVLDAEGNVIGVVTAMMTRIPGPNGVALVPQNVNFAIKAAIVRNFLETNHVAMAGAASRVATPAAAAVGEAARKFTVRVECRR
jgi:S1-C subfamily serine protease